MDHLATYNQPPRISPNKITKRAGNVARAYAHLVGEGDAIARAYTERLHGLVVELAEASNRPNLAERDALMRDACARIEHVLREIEDKALRYCCERNPHLEAWDGWNAALDAV